MQDSVKPVATSFVLTRSINYILHNHCLDQPIDGRNMQTNLKLGRQSPRWLQIYDSWLLRSSASFGCKQFNTQPTTADHYSKPEHVMRR